MGAHSLESGGSGEVWGVLGCGAAFAALFFYGDDIGRMLSEASGGLSDGGADTEGGSTENGSEWDEEFEEKHDGKTRGELKEELDTIVDWELPRAQQKGDLQEVEKLRAEIEWLNEKLPQWLRR